MRNTETTPNKTPSRVILVSIAIILICGAFCGVGAAEEEMTVKILGDKTTFELHEAFQLLIQAPWFIKEGSVDLSFEYPQYIVGPGKICRNLDPYEFGEVYVMVNSQQTGSGGWIKIHDNKYGSTISVGPITVIPR